MIDRKGQCECCCRSRVPVFFASPNASRICLDCANLVRGALTNYDEPEPEKKP